MKIQYCSDLHLEFPENKQYIHQNPIEVVGDILVLAGDIWLISHLQTKLDFFDIVSQQYKAVYWLPGNHEYYRSDIGKYPNPLEITIRDNVFLVNNVAIEHDNANLILTTLWADIKTQNKNIVQDSVSDFHVIGVNGKRFSADHFNDLHDESKRFIKNSFSRDKKNIVVTHHVPTLKSYPSKYLGSSINEAFAVEMEDFIIENPIDYWIYGHSHVNTPEFNIGGTKLITNQLGYVRHNEHDTFISDAFIEID